jgi:large subunit ribosomal protein L24
MKIHKGDNIIVISGASKGKTGKVSKVFPDHGSIVVPGVNIRKKHQKARRTGQKGQLTEVAMPFPASKAALVDPSSGKATRVGRTLVGEKWVRVSKRSGKEI